MRVKGKFVGTINIDFDFEKGPNMRKFETMHKTVTKQMPALITEIISEEIGDELGAVSVTQQYADLYEADD